MFADTSRICGQERGTIDCGPDLHIMHVKSANYGRTSSKYCQNGPSAARRLTSCYSPQPNTLRTVRKFCEGRQRCSLEAKNSLYGGDPCWGTNKYLEIHFQCSGIIINFYYFYLTAVCCILKLSEQSAPRFTRGRYK